MKKRYFICLKNYRYRWGFQLKVSADTDNRYRPIPITDISADTDTDINIGRSLVVTLTALQTQLSLHSGGTSLRDIIVFVNITKESDLIPWGDPLEHYCRPCQSQQIARIAKVRFPVDRR